MKRKRQSLCWRGDRKKFKCDGDGGDGDDDDDGGGGGAGAGAGAAGAAAAGGGGNERANNLFLRANQPSSEALSHQNPTTPTSVRNKSQAFKVSNSERRRQESVEHPTLLLSRLNCSTLTMIGCTGL